MTGWPPKSSKWIILFQLFKTTSNWELALEHKGCEVISCCSVLVCSVLSVVLLRGTWRLQYRAQRGEDTSADNCAVKSEKYRKELFTKTPSLPSRPEEGIPLTLSSHCPGNTLVLILECQISWSLTMWLTTLFPGVYCSLGNKELFWGI